MVRELRCVGVAVCCEWLASPSDIVLWENSLWTRCLRSKSAACSENCCCLHCHWEEKIMNTFRVRHYVCAAAFGTCTKYTYNWNNTITWYSRHIVVGNNTEIWYTRHIFVGNNTETWYSRHIVVWNNSETWYNRHIFVGNNTETWYSRHIVVGNSTETWHIRHIVVWNNTETWYSRHIVVWNNTETDTAGTLLWGIVLKHDTAAHCCGE